MAARAQGPRDQDETECPFAETKELVESGSSDLEIRPAGVNELRAKIAKHTK